MSRQITPAEIKVGMEIEWVSKGFTVSGTVNGLAVVGGEAVYVYAPGNVADALYVGGGTPVTVLKEAPPEEPQAFGAIVEVGGARYARCSGDASVAFPWIKEVSGVIWNWANLLERGTPEILVADPLANTTPAVPDVIEDGEWPEDDEHLRSHKWRDRDGDVWWHEEGWHWARRHATVPSRVRPYDGPWERVDE